MRALVYEAPWRMALREVGDPQPGPGEVVVGVYASGICGSDVHGFTGTTGRRQPPLVMGHEVAGTVEAVGEGVTGFLRGDRVVLRSILACGSCSTCRAGRPNICLHRRSLGIHLPGGYAEAVCVPAAMAEPLPDGLDWELAAMIEPLSVAMHAVNLTPFELMDSVVIIGAGTLGLLSVLTARLRGAGTLIVVDVNPRRLAIAEELGAAIALNATETDVQAVVRDATGGHGAGAVVEAVGLEATAAQSISLARAGGHVTWIGNLQPRVELGMQEVVTRELTIQGAYGSNEEFPLAAAALERFGGEVRRLIEHRAPLEDGPRLFTDLANGELDAVKVIVSPRAA
jgi:L-iditol 2-dehydrogenase